MKGMRLLVETNLKVGLGIVSLPPNTALKTKYCHVEMANEQ
jgi:hypothetical protein